jgi:hypothetical protein
VVLTHNAVLNELNIVWDGGVKFDHDHPGCIALMIVPDNAIASVDVLTQEIEPKRDRGSWYYGIWSRGTEIHYIIEECSEARKESADGDCRFEGPADCAVGTERRRAGLSGPASASSPRLIWTKSADQMVKSEKRWIIWQDGSGVGSVCRDRCGFRTPDPVRALRPVSGDARSR